MVRDALFADIPQLVRLMKEAHGRSVYAGTDVGFDEAEAKRLLVNGIQRHGGTVNGSTLVLVSERDSAVTGLLFGVLDRIQGVGTKLYATDLFFFVSQDAPPADAGRMMKRLQEWAISSKHVREIVLGATSILMPFENTARLYQRAGFETYGGIYRQVVSQGTPQ